AANAACVTCIETDVGAAKHGPILTQGTGAELQVVDANWGGCEAALDGNVTAQGCGAKFNSFNDCIYNNCGLCADIANPQPNGAFAACRKASFEPNGTCAPYATTSACTGEFSADGGVARTCGPQLVDLLKTWCGG